MSGRPRRWHGRAIAAICRFLDAAMLGEPAFSGQNRESSVENPAFPSVNIDCTECVFRAGY